MESIKIINKLLIKKTYMLGSRVPRPKLCLQWRGGDSYSLVTEREEGLGMQLLEHAGEALAPLTPEEVAGEHVM